MMIAENVARVRERMEAAAKRAGRDLAKVRLVAVSKTVGLDRILQAIEAGVDSLGENYVQEAQEKIGALEQRISWHFIGHLQSNKAKVAARLFDWVHSVDSLKLAEELSRAGRQQSKILPVLLQVNLGKEETKFGAQEEEVFRLLERMGSLPGVSVKGLMAMPPFFENPEESRPYFRALRILAENVSKRQITGVLMEELSMGMSNDFEVAIEEGATLVRVGTAVFGPRPPR
ncbi:MAG TPA: YggS family pyridoxal phosphate-dependent enzyme [Thermodesulfobacteriota bacterium]|nr:YggS family pyridoxal phosphate-dependent enzyme [Thermodesulfobacteriota bacterium]